MIVFWLYAATLICIAGSRLFQLSHPPAVMVLLQALTPVIYLPMYVVAAVTAWRRRWLECAAALGLIVIHICSVAPAVGTADVPDWAASSPALKVVLANVNDNNEQPDRAAATLLAQHADVMIVVEITPPFERSLVQAGVNSSYPYRVIGTHGDIDSSENIYSRLPLSNVRQLAVSNSTFGISDIDVGGTPLSLLAVHIESAKVNADEWRSELRGIRDLMDETAGPDVVIGDFNAGRWNPEFGDLLSSGWYDAHESRGSGLTFSWPAADFNIPLIRLDHALVSDRVAVRTVHDFSMPGSDHRAFVAVLAVRTS